MDIMLLLQVVSEGSRDCSGVGWVTTVFAVVYKFVFTANTLRFGTLRLASMLPGGICCTFACSRLGSRGLSFRGLRRLNRVLN